MGLQRYTIVSYFIVIRVTKLWIQRFMFMILSHNKQK